MTDKCVRVVALCLAAGCSAAEPSSVDDGSQVDDGSFDGGAITLDSGDAGQSAHHDADLAPGDGPAAAVDAASPLLPTLTWGHIAAGNDYTCAIDVNRAITCWGKNYEAELPQGRFKHIAAGHRNACAVREDGAVACWFNRRDVNQGDLGESIPDGPFVTVHTGGTRGAEFGCALTAEGEARCWSAREQVAVKSLIRAPADARFRTLALGDQHACGLTLLGTMICWAALPTSPLLEPPQGPFTDVCAGFGFACAVDAPGVPTCWGTQLTWPSRWPTTAVARALACTASGPLACTIVGSGRGYCTDADGPWSGAPEVESRFREQAVGVDHACGVLADGAVECWTSQATPNAAALQAPSGLRIAAD